MSVSQQAHARLVQDMAYFDAQPEAKRKLLQEFSVSDVEAAIRAVGQEDWEAVGRVLFWTRRRLMEKKMESAYRDRDHRDAA